jgi:hypothetical protein
MYEPPKIDNVLSYLDGSRSNNEFTEDTEEDPKKHVLTSNSSNPRGTLDRSQCFPVCEDVAENEDELEERLNFIEILRFAYHQQIKYGKQSK